MLTRRVIFSGAILGLALTACGSNHAATNHGEASHSAISSGAAAAPASPVLAADQTMCKLFNASIGNGGEYQIAQALQTAGTSISSKLGQDIAKVLTTTTLQSNLIAQVRVTVDCALVKSGVTPGQG